MPSDLKQATPWRMVPLADCLRGEPQYGANAPAIDYNPGLPRYIRITDIDEYGCLKREGAKSIPTKASLKYLLKKRDFLLARSGATVGKAYLHREVQGDYAYAGYLIRFPLNEERLLPEFLAQFTQSMKYKLWVSKVIRRGAQPNINAQEYLRLLIPCPPLKAQGKMVAWLSWWDKLIEKTERLIEAKNQRWRAYLARLIHDPQHPSRQLGEVMTEISRKNNGFPTCQRVLSVTNHSGFVLSEEQFLHCPASQDLAKYKVVGAGEYGYNPSRLRVGSIARLNEFEEGVLSPMYVVFKLNEQKINSDFFFHWLSSTKARQAISRSAQGSVRETISFRDFEALSIPLPSLIDQERVACLLGAMKQEIGLLKAQMKIYSRQKAAIMQKLAIG